MAQKDAFKNHVSLFTVEKSNSTDKQPVDYVNPFIGTTNYGTTNPGAIVPNGLMSVVPFNVMGSELNKYDKDSQWWSTPYDFTNKYFTGFAHVSLSGVGCPDLGSLLLMPTTGNLNVDYKEYGSEYTNEFASPGYYTNVLTKYGIKNEVSATRRTSIARFTFPKGKANILLNLGEGLTNESGAMVRKVSDNEIEGVKMQGTFCYNPQAVFPIYFVMKVDKTPLTSGYWKKQREMGVEKNWDSTAGTYKLYTKYDRQLMGDDIGAFFSFDVEKDEVVEVKIGVSFVSIENARLNLETEQPDFDFEKVYADARNTWNENLSRILVEGGSDDKKTVFYSALYHTLIHPSVLNDVNGEYPAMETGKTLKGERDRYTVFSLWDTYRNVHQLMSLVYPEKQIDMVNTMVDMYKESGWMPKWELFGRETFTMEGDPSIPVIVDTWKRGLRDFDVEAAYQAMYKSATLPEKENLMRPDIDCYYEKGYVPLTEQFDNSVSHALEYYIADFALAEFADALGKKEDAKLFRKRSLGYKNYYSKEYGTFRPITPDGKFLTPFDPKQGENFEPSPGFHEGNAWNYTFFVPHDVEGLAKLMGGKRKFVDKLQMVFDNNLFDMSNEPDIAYPHLFSYFKGEEWRTQKEVVRLLDKHFKNAPNGIPGNDDTGTMSAWAIFNMMGFYPDCPGKAEYTLTTPAFDRVTIKLDGKYYPNEELVIEKSGNSNDGENWKISTIKLDGKKYDSYRISHQKLFENKKLEVITY
ncbi:MAG: GH92 family glycosyl hydrolase [Bacteroidales bacterium]|nr:GH92 family glycosyl hydrolase [Bacteroidales bacterium]